MTLDVREVCRLKWSLVAEGVLTNCFDAPRNQPEARAAAGYSRTFTGCPACKREAETMTMDEIRADMLAHIERIRSATTTPAKGG